jgi:Mn2+/Fe2+ NRAMP family transporter
MSGMVVAIFVGLLNRMLVFCVSLCSLITFFQSHLIFLWGYLKDVMYSIKTTPARNWTVTANPAEALFAEAGVRHFEYLCWIQ